VDCKEVATFDFLFCFVFFFGEKGNTDPFFLAKLFYNKKTSCQIFGLG
jgi:hypothetical protein